MLELFRYSDIQTTDLYLALYYLCSKEGLARAPRTSIPLFTSKQKCAISIIMWFLFLLFQKEGGCDQLFVDPSLQARSRISSRVKAIIEERRSRKSRSLRNDFLEILLSVDTLSEDEKVSFVLDSLLGGYETTSLLMAMVVHLLGQSPTALEQLKVTFSTHAPCLLTIW